MSMLHHWINRVLDRLFDNPERLSFIVSIIAFVLMFVACVGGSILAAYIIDNAQGHPECVWQNCVKVVP